jgi:hypothetical protein
MCFQTHLFRILLVLVPVMMLSASDSSPHIFLSFQSLQQLDALSSGPIRSLEDATAYVRKAAEQFGVTNPALLPDGLESRLAAAELAAANDPDKLVSDEQVAEAFNFLSNEFHVANPERLTGADILLYRGVKASMFPHLYSAKSVNGSRPVGALVMLDTLVHEGGIMEGVRNAAQLDRPPGSLKVTRVQIVGHSGPGNVSPIQREYRTASLTYFAQQSQQDTKPFLDQLARILALPVGR